MGPFSWLYGGGPMFGHPGGGMPAGNEYSPPPEIGTAMASQVAQGAGQSQRRGGGDEVAGGYGYAPGMAQQAALFGSTGGFGQFFGQGGAGGQRGGGDQIAGGSGYSPGGAYPAMGTATASQRAQGPGQTQRRGGGDAIPGGTGYDPNSGRGMALQRKIAGGGR